MRFAAAWMIALGMSGLTGALAQVPGQPRNGANLAPGEIDFTTGPAPVRSRDWSLFVTVAGGRNFSRSLWSVSSTGGFEWAAVLRPTGGRESEATYGVTFHPGLQYRVDVNPESGGVLRAAVRAGIVDTWRVRRVTCNATRELTAGERATFARIRRLSGQLNDLEAQRVRARDELNTASAAQVEAWRPRVARQLAIPYLYAGDESMTSDAQLSALTQWSQEASKMIIRGVASGRAQNTIIDQVCNSALPPSRDACRRLLSDGVGVLNPRVLRSFYALHQITGELTSLQTQLELLRQATNPVVRRPLQAQIAATRSRIAPYLLESSPELLTAAQASAGYFQAAMLVSPDRFTRYSAVATALLAVEIPESGHLPEDARQGWCDRNFQNEGGGSVAECVQRLDGMADWLARFVRPAQLNLRPLRARLAALEAREVNVHRAQIRAGLASLNRECGNFQESDDRPLDAQIEEAERYALRAPNSAMTVTVLRPEFFWDLNRWTGRAATGAEMNVVRVDLQASGRLDRTRFTAWGGFMGALGGGQFQVHDRSAAGFVGGVDAHIGGAMMLPGQIFELSDEFNLNVRGNTGSVEGYRMSFANTFAVDRIANGPFGIGYMVEAQQAGGSGMGTLVLPVTHFGLFRVAP